MSWKLVKVTSWSYVIYDELVDLVWHNCLLTVECSLGFLVFMTAQSAADTLQKQVKFTMNLQTGGRAYPTQSITSPPVALTFHTFHTGAESCSRILWYVGWKFDSLKGAGIKLKTFWSVDTAAPEPQSFRGSLTITHNNPFHGIHIIHRCKVSRS